MTSFAANKDTHRFEALFNHASMGIVVVDHHGIIQSVNPFALRLFGYTVAEIVGKPIEILIPRRYNHKHIGHRQEYTANPKSRPMGVGMDLFAVKKDGTEFPVEVSLGNYNYNGDEYVIAFISNISVRKKAEAEIVQLKDELEAVVEQRTKDLKDTLQQLEISRTLLEEVMSFQKAILDNAGAMLIVTDDKGIIKLFNPEAATNIGYEELEVVHQQTPVLFHDPQEIVRKRQKLLQEFAINISDDFSVLVEKARRGIHEEEQFRYIRKNGTSFPVSLTITTIRDHEGNITGFLGIGIDISERIKAEEELRKSLEKEKELNELKSRFVSMASHEFRTPLSTVLSAAYLIEKYTRTEDQSKREKHLQQVYSSVNMLTDTLNDFLSVGKIEEGKIQVRLSHFNIRELISIVITDFHQNLKAGQRIVYVHEGVENVLLDVSLLKHIVMNLVSNASKFSPENSEILVSTTVTAQTVTLSVKDEGMGISLDDQQHLMERFFRGANAGNIQGTGLGLHIVSKYAELMNGMLICKSELEKGTEFITKFTIPTKKQT